MKNISKSKLIDWLDSNGWMVCEINSKRWKIVDVAWHKAEIIVTLHNDGRTATYEIPCMR